MRISALAAILLAGAAMAIPTPNLPERADLARRNPNPGNEVANPAAITGITCTAPGVTLVDHDVNVALLSICGGIAGKIEKCGGSPTDTTGISGTAKFELEVATAGSTIDVTKGRWEGCVRAARAVCGDSPFSATCIGGANGNKDNVLFQLSANSK